MTKSLWRLINTNRGYEPSGVLTARIDPTTSRYRNANQLYSFYQRLIERIQAIPGVERAAITNGFLDRGCRVSVAERPPVPEKERPLATRTPVSADFFEAMRIPLLRGRAFTEHDTAGAHSVAIVDETIVRRYFPYEDPIGKHLINNDETREIVGVVGATRAWKTYSDTLDQVVPRIYVPFEQEEPWSSTMELMVRAKSGDPIALISDIRAELAAVDRDQPIHSFELLSQALVELRSERRFSTLLLSAFAAIAVALAAIGVYGVLTYSVSCSTQELGIRLALGAQPSDILHLVIGAGMRTVVVGLALGLLGAFGLTRLIESMLFDVRGTDPLTFAAISVLLASVGLVACLLPARRATRVDPLTVIRTE